MLLREEILLQDEYHLAICFSTINIARCYGRSRMALWSPLYGEFGRRDSNGIPAERTLKPARRRSFIMWKTIIPRALLALILIGALDVALVQWLRQLGANPYGPDSTANRSAVIASLVDRNRSAIPMGIRELLVSIQLEQPLSAQCAEALRSVGQLSRSERQSVSSGLGAQPVRTQRHWGLARRYRQSVRCRVSAPWWQPQQRVPLGLVDPG